MENFGKSLGLETLVDQVGNVVIRKDAAEGMEGAKGVILQGHLDMVPQKNSETEHNFLTDPIRLQRDGDWIKACETTLGADNGIGIAAAMAVLESKSLRHGPVEALFTVDEEAGMTGAFALQTGVLQGDILLNLDSEDEGDLYIGCAGGVDIDALFHCDYQRLDSNYQAFRFSVTGLKGGHSGLDIGLGRGNACLLLVNVLLEASERFSLRVSRIQAGSLRNAIPREAFTTIAVKPEESHAFRRFVNERAVKISKALHASDPDVSIRIEECELPDTVISSDAQNNIFRAVDSCPNGVIAFDESLGVVETSSNLAMIHSDDTQVKISCLTRSADNTARDAVAMDIVKSFECYHASVQTSGSYPGWVPNPSSPALLLMQQVYQNRFQCNAQVKVIHAGLECGILGDKYPHLDLVSFGPTIRNPHSPDEKVHVGSVAKFWDLLVNTLESIPEK